MASVVWCSSGDSDATWRHFRSVAASIACRASIKVNLPLDAQRIGRPLGALAATDCPMSCPHGRPTALRYSLRDILKGFHRV